MNNDYEMTFNSDTQINICEEQGDLPTMKFNFIPINQLESHQPNSTVGKFIGIQRCRCDANNYSDNVLEFPEQNKDSSSMVAIPTTEEVINYLKLAQRYVMGNDKLYGLADQLLTGVQNMKVEQEVSNGNKQATITSFFVVKLTKMRSTTYPKCI